MTDVVLDEILEELDEVDTPCGHCGRPMASMTQWEAANDAERTELRDEGYVVTGARGVCKDCADTMPREEYLALPGPGSAGNRPPDASTLLMVKEVDAHLKNGGALADIAGRYPLKPDSIRRAMARARRRGDIQ